MSEPKYLPPEPYTCATCIHFRPEIVYTHNGKPRVLAISISLVPPQTAELAHFDARPFPRKAIRLSRGPRWVRPLRHPPPDPLRNHPHLPLLGGK